VVRAERAERGLTQGEGRMLRRRGGQRGGVRYDASGISAWQFSNTLPELSSSGSGLTVRFLLARTLFATISFIRLIGEEPLRESKHFVDVNARRLGVTAALGRPGHWSLLRLEVRLWESIPFLASGQFRLLAGRQPLEPDQYDNLNRLFQFCDGRLDRCRRE
jgi:hypothetical protein